MIKKILILTILTTLTNSAALAHGGDSGDHFEAMPVTVESNKVIVRSLGIQTEKVIEKDIDEVIKTTGQIEPLPNNEFEVTSPVQGKVKFIYANLGDLVNKGQNLLQIESPEIAKLYSELEQFRAEADLANSNFEREKYLFDHGVSAKKDFEAANAILLSAEARLNAAKNNLRILTGGSDLASEGVFSVLSPKRGTIIERTITIGQVINVNQPLLKGIDLTSVWARADIYEKDQDSLSLGQNAIISLDGENENKYIGKITYLGSIVNKESRTIPVTVTLNNLSLKPGTFVHITINTQKKKKKIIIPKTALATSDNEEVDGKHEHIVFIKENDHYIPREIVVEPHDSNSVIVVSGLKSGEEIVTRGAYQLQFGKANHEDEELSEKKADSNLNINNFLLFLIALFLGIMLGKFKK